MTEILSETLKKIFEKPINGYGNAIERKKRIPEKTVRDINHRMEELWNQCERHESEIKDWQFEEFCKKMEDRGLFKL